MIELPEAVVLSGEINDTLSGKTINSVIAGKSPHKFAWYHEEPKEYHDRLHGKTIRSAKHQGGMVEITIDMYGGLVAFKEGELTNKYYLAAREKPSPFSSRFNDSYFDKLFAASPDNISLKAFLATEQRIPGLGNGVLQDILFNSGFHPKKKINSLTDKDLESIFHSIKSTLTQMARQGGRSTEKDIFGIAGGYQCLLCKNTPGKPCPVCGTTIKKMAYMGGNVYVCEKCQKM